VDTLAKLHPATLVKSAKGGELMKKLLIAVLVALGIFAAAPESNAGVSVGIGFGLPIGYYSRCAPYYPYGYYPYGYYPYGYYRYPVYAPVYRIGYRRPHYWYQGRRIYYRGHCW
jgi:hypothetical protein